jgi:hypothetical protein
MLYIQHLHWRIKNMIKPLNTIFDQQVSYTDIDGRTKGTPLEIALDSDNNIMYRFSNAYNPLKENHRPVSISDLQPSHLDTMFARVITLKDKVEINPARFHTLNPGLASRLYGSVVQD